MGPINGVLNETFFKVVSLEYLTALSKLIGDVLAVCFTNYLNSTTVDNPIAAIVNNHLGQATKVATFHIQPLERGSAKTVEKIELETVVSMRFDQRAVIEGLEFLEKNIEYMRSFLEPRRKADYDALVALLPADYGTKVANNRVIFCQPHAKMRSTGVGIIDRRYDVWTVALKGLKHREYITRSRYAMDSYVVKEF